MAQILERMQQAAEGDERMTTGPAADAAMS